MKRIISTVLICVLLMTGILPQTAVALSPASTSSLDPITGLNPDIQQANIDFPELNNPVFLEYVENNVYDDLINQLDSDLYFVENVKAMYISQEYLDEVAYNSQANIYFGYTLAELESNFQGEKYIFTLGEDGQTIVEKFTEYDDSYEKVVRNVVTGTGVILVCVTISALTAVSAPAVSLIFAASAKTGTTIALSAGVFSSASTALIKGIETNDIRQTVKSALLSGSESFKWGAISGVLLGGYGKALALRGATCNGITMNEAAKIQKESKLPLDFIKNFHSVDEYNVYKKANLEIIKLNGKWAYVQKIDWTYKDASGRTNAERVQAGFSPLDPSGKPYELHHIGQRADSPLAILTNEQHRSNAGVLNKFKGAGEGKNVAENIWKSQRNDFYKAFYNKTIM